MVNWRNYFTASILQKGKNYQKRGVVQDIQESNGKYFTNAMNDGAKL